MGKIIISTPKNGKVKVRVKGGIVSAALVMKSDFGKRYTSNFQRAQAFVDDEVIRFCSVRVPVAFGYAGAGRLRRSVEAKGGLVVYTAGYGRLQYYRTSQSRPYDANRGAFWFERGKVQERGRILREAARIAGGRL